MIKSSPLKEERNCMKLIKNESIPYLDYYNYNEGSHELNKMPSIMIPELPILYQSNSYLKEKEGMKYAIYPSKNYCSLHDPIKKACSLGIEIIYPENISLGRANKLIPNSNNTRIENCTKVNLSQKMNLPNHAQKSWNISTIDYDICLQFKRKNEKISKKLRKVIEKVIEWRRLSTKSGSQQFTKEEAAVKLGMKKKSLDDFLMYLRLGIVLGYDFESNIDNKFGNLKRFILEFRR